MYSRLSCTNHTNTLALKFQTNSVPCNNANVLSLVMCLILSLTIRCQMRCHTYAADKDSSNLLWLVNTFLQLQLERAANSNKTHACQTEVTILAPIQSRSSCYAVHVILCYAPCCLCHLSLSVATCLLSLALAELHWLLAEC